MEDNEKLAFVSVSHIKNPDELKEITGWLNNNKPKGWQFVVSTCFHALTKDEVEALYAHLGVILEKV